MSAPTHPPSYTRSLDAPSSPPPHTPSEAPPGYDSSSSLNSKEFRVGAHETKALVTAPEIRAHLLLLAAFNHLRQTVEESDWSQGTKTTTRPLPEAKWALFIFRAVWRFTLFLKRLDRYPLRYSPGPPRVLERNDIPPLDVLMVLHSYMSLLDDLVIHVSYFSTVLNPFIYLEDITLRHRQLKSLEEFPLMAVASMIDMETLEFIATPEQMIRWERLTGTTFNMPFVTIESDTIEIPCPMCISSITVPWICPTTTPTGQRSSSVNLTIGTGYAQNEFWCECPSCGGKVDRDAMRVEKLLRDIAKYATNHDFTLPSTLTTSAGTHDLERGRDISSACVSALRTSKNPTVPFDLEARLDWKMNNVYVWLEKGFSLYSHAAQIAKPKLGSLLAAYASEMPFSFDLVGATLRQSIFTSQIHELGWTQPGIFDAQSSDLDSAISRYHTFLDLCSRVVLTRVVIPTVDIDLVWHTHLLRHVEYRAQTKGLLGRILNHNDKVEEGMMSTSFDETAQMWKERYKSPYSSCSCLPPPEDLFPFFKKKGKGREDATLPNMAQHPSDHMSVVVRDNPRIEWMKQRREEKFREEERRKAKHAMEKKEKQPKRPVSAGGRLTSSPMSIFASFTHSNSQLNPTVPGPNAASSRPQVSQLVPASGSSVPPPLPDVPRSATAFGFFNMAVGSPGHHERAFARTLLVDTTFAKAGPGGLGLMGYVDPRIVDGMQLDRSEKVVGGAAALSAKQGTPVVHTPGYVGPSNTS